MTATELPVDSLTPLTAMPAGGEWVVSIPKSGNSGPSKFALIAGTAVPTPDAVTTAVANATNALGIASGAQTTANAAMVAANSASNTANAAQAAATTSGQTASTALSLAGNTQVVAAGALPKAGGVMAGQIVQSLAPTQGNHLVNKDYTDSSITAAVQSAGSISLANSNPGVNGTAAAGTSTSVSRGDHIHPTDTSRYAASNPLNYQTATQVQASIGAASGLGAGNFVVGTPYTANGTISTTDLIVVFNSATDLNMTLPDGTTNRPPMIMINMNTGVARISAKVNGSASTITIYNTGSVTVGWAQSLSTYLRIGQVTPTVSLSTVPSATLAGTELVAVADPDGTLKQTTLNALASFLGTSGGYQYITAATLSGFPTTGTNGTALNLVGATVALTPVGGTAYAALVGPGGEIGNRTAFNGATPPTKTPTSTGAYTYRVFATFSGGTALATSPTITVS